MSIHTKRCSLIILFLWGMTGDATLPSASAAAPSEQARTHAQQRARVANEHDSSASQEPSRQNLSLLGLALLLFVGLGSMWHRFFTAKTAGKRQDEIDTRAPEGIENLQEMWSSPHLETGDLEWKPVDATTAPSVEDRSTDPKVDKPTDRPPQTQPRLPQTVEPSRSSQLSLAPITPKKKKATTSPATPKPAAPAPVSPATPHVGPGAPAVPHVLVVEDNVVNQKLLVRILEKMGYTADSAGNGKAGLAAVTHTAYTLILMDCQMPEMHGFEATARIRQHEAQTGTHTHIVAVTAETSPGAREACLKAGMDEYMAKPIKPQILRDVLARWAPLPADAVQAQNTPSNKSKKTPSAAALPPPCNISQALVHIDGDRELLQEMAEVFLTECPYFLEQIQTTIAEDDGLVLASAARTLKVSVSNFVASEVFEAAAALEKIGMQGDLSPASAALLRLEQALGRLKPALSDLKQLAA